jgi:hypothetical protein
LAVSAAKLAAAALAAAGLATALSLTKARAIGDWRALISPTLPVMKKKHRKTVLFAGVSGD